MGETTDRLLDEILRRHMLTLNRAGDLVELETYHGRGARSAALADQLERLGQRQKTPKTLSEEMEMLHLKAATVPPLKHSPTLPPLDSNGHVLDLRAGGLVKKIKD